MRPSAWCRRQVAAALRALTARLSAVADGLSVTANTSPTDESATISKITVMAEGVARARRESMQRAGVGASVTPELLRHAQECGERLRRKAWGR